jgi:hypothetical protein
MECFNSKCVCGALCTVAGCVLLHPLFKGYEQEMMWAVGHLKGKAQDREVIQQFQLKQPPKVRRRYTAKFPKKRTKKPNMPQVDSNGESFCYYGPQKCYQVGVLKSNIGNWAVAGELVFADSQNEKYIIPDGNGSYRGYYQSAIEKYVERFPPPPPKMSRKIRKMMGDVHLSVNNNTRRT